MIMHGANDSLNGKNLYDIQDKNGLYLFREIVNAAKSTNEGGLVKYYWEKPGESKPILKYSYMAYFSKWDYIIVCFEEFTQ
jgi:methyl-accepting chemotaxis protein